MVLLAAISGPRLEFGTLEVGCPRALHPEGFKSRTGWCVLHRGTRAPLVHPSFALPRAPGQHPWGSHAPPSGGGHHGGLCPHRLCHAGPAVLEEGEGAEVSSRPGRGQCGWGRSGIFPKRLPTPLPPWARSHAPLHPLQGREESVFPRADSF